VTKAVHTPNGRHTKVQVPRINYRECLTPVRAFHLDLAQWAVEDLARWGPWVAPCPVGAEEINRRKFKRHPKARMDARTRERLPVLPVLVATVDQRRKAAAALLAAARQTPPGHAFTAAGQTLARAMTHRSAATKVWAEDPATGTRRDLGREEDHAFWAWAAVEVLRATGIRLEELTELSHHSLVSDRLPTTGELVPLLQIVPSKTHAERLLLVSPELAEMLSAIICRVRDASGAVPLVAAYDTRERSWSPPAPLLFQRQVGHERRAITPGSIRRLLTAALAHTGLVDPASGGPLHFTPHDFRRLFITDAILSGLPPHIAQVIAGHRDINVTLGYKPVYPDEAIQAHLAFLARRRALRPSEEYRAPTDKEWTEFLGHFERRKVSIGACGRAFATPCIHEHACLSEPAEKVLKDAVRSAALVAHLVSERPSRRRRISSLSSQRSVSRPKRRPCWALMASASRRRCARSRSSMISTASSIAWYCSNALRECSIAASAASKFRSSRLACIMARAVMRSSSLPSRSQRATSAGSKGCSAASRRARATTSSIARVRSGPGRMVPRTDR
jgi:integrase